MLILPTLLFIPSALAHVFYLSIIMALFILYCCLLHRPCACLFIVYICLLLPLLRYLGMKKLSHLYRHYLLAGCVCKSDGCVVFYLKSGGCACMDLNIFGVPALLVSAPSPCPGFYSHSNSFFTCGYLLVLTSTSISISISTSISIPILMLLFLL